MHGSQVDSQTARRSDRRDTTTIARPRLLALTTPLECAARRRRCRVARRLEARLDHLKAIGGSALAEDVRELQHGGARRSEALHQTVDRIDGGLPDLLREMGVDLGGPGAAVPESLLDQAEVDAVFEEVGGVGVPLMPLAA